MRLSLALDGCPDTDDEELADLTAQLRARLLELDVESVQSVRSDDIPPGAKPVEAIIIGGLMISMPAATLHAVLNVAQTWLENRPIRSAKVAIGDDSIELANPSRRDQRHLTDAFIERHRGD